jgi:Fur family transcriptional regulator, ferric uptake regulator
MTSKPRSHPDEALRAMLVSRGLRVTLQRLAILRELSRLRVPTSHPELTERLSDTHLDRATVYRNLLSLTAAGLLVRTHLGDNVWRFELPRSESREHDRHPHFVCKECGDVACLPSDSVRLSGAAKRNQVAEVELRGRCSTCAQPRRDARSPGH